MKIAHCIHGLGLGGAQQVVKAIVQGSDKRFVRYYVYSSADGCFRHDIEAAGATVRVIKRRLPKFDPFWVAALSRAMKRDRIDLVHTHLFGDSLHGYLAARVVGGLPVVMTIHCGDQAHTRLQLRAYRWLLRRTTHTVACSDSVRTFFKRNSSMAASRIKTITNGIESRLEDSITHGNAVGRILNLGVDPQRQLIGAVGRMVYQKGYGYLLEALARLRQSAQPMFQLILLGQGPLQAALERRASQLRLGDLVIFAGFQPDVRNLLPLFDIIVFASLYEGLSVALLEAMAASRCIVATDVPGITEALTHEREALIVPSRHPSRLAQALSRALSDGDLRLRLGEAAHRRFLHRFTADRMVSSYERIYREAYKNHGG